ncbi:MAG: hypothetical protein INQ03_21640 [Candidatus Heimdallarchaeota archaeon]|nr:hypothetical protein [Candidatus Heimdallarchaeota archaeon]
MQRYEYFLSNIKQHLVSALVFTLSSIVLVFLMISKYNRQFGLNIVMGMSNDRYMYFNKLGEEIVVLLGGVAIGTLIVISILHLVDLQSMAIRVLASPLIYFVLMIIIPVWIFLSSIDSNLLIYDGARDTSTARVLFPMMGFIALYVTAVLLKEIGPTHDANLEEFGQYRYIYPLIIAKNKSYQFLMYHFVLTIVFNMPYTARYMIREFLFLDSYFFGLVNPDNFLSFYVAVDVVTIPGGIIVFSIMILAVQIIFSAIISGTVDNEYIDSLEILNQMRIGNPMAMKSLHKLFAIIPMTLGFFMIIIVILFPINPLLSQMQEKVFIFFNPNYVNFSYINTAPSGQHLFGTDDVGRDIFSRVMFSLPTMVLVILFCIIWISILFIIYSRITKNMDVQKKLSILTHLNQIPSFPLLLIILLFVIYVPLNGAEEIAVVNLLVYVLIIYSVISFPRYAYIFEINGGEREEGISGKIFNPVKLHLVAEMFADISILAYYGFIKSSAIIIGGMFGDAINNRPLLNWWGWVYPLLSIILILSAFRSHGIKS